MKKGECDKLVYRVKQFNFTFLHNNCFSYDIVLKLLTFFGKFSKFRNLFIDKVYGFEERISYPNDRFLFVVVIIMKVRRIIGMILLWLIFTQRELYLLLFYSFGHGHCFCLVFVL